MQLTRHIHLVGSGGEGFDLSHPMDCHVYLIDGGSELALIDAGIGLDADMIIANITAMGFNPTDIKKVLLTHGHADHAGGSAPLQDRTGAQIWAPRNAVSWIETGDEDAISLTVARKSGNYPVDYRFRPCGNVCPFDDGDQIQVGNISLIPIDTPGHAAVHFSFLIQGDDRPGLFCGDLLFHGGRIHLLNTIDCSITQLSSSIHRLRRMDVEGLYPGHGLISVRRGQSHIDAAAHILDSQKIPSPFH
jgi:hydroxyacylglutathione hydrolase